MGIGSRFLSCAVLLGIAASLTVAPATVWSQGMVGHIDHIYPAGGQRGSTVRIGVFGDSLGKSSAVRVTGEGVTGKVVEVVQPTKDTLGSIVCELTIDAQAPRGLRDLRLQSPGGFTNRVLFAVGDLPEVNEEEPNSRPGEGQQLPKLPVTVNGQIMQADVDRFRFSATAGETLVCRVEAQALRPFIADGVPGWFQAVLALYDASGKQVAYVDDFRFQPDPVLIYKVEKDGEYTAEIRDAIYRGRGDFVYRLSIGRLPYITGIWPRGANPGTTTSVKLDGENLPQDAIEITAPKDATAPQTIQVTTGGIASNRLPFVVTGPPTATEKEPNNTAEAAQEIAVPASVDGRISEPGDVDYFRIQGKTKQRLHIDLLARRVESPLDSLVTLYDSNGQQLAENDDTVDEYYQHMTHHADSQLVFTFPKDGEYLLRVSDVQGNGGDAYSYRMVIAPPAPDFQLRVTPEVPRLSQDSSTVLTVHALRKHGFEGEIALSVENLPEGFEAAGTLIPEGADQTILTLSAPADAPLEVFTPRIVGTAEVGGNTVARQAIPVEDVMQAFYYHHLLPTDEFLLTVLEPGPFKLVPQVPEGYVRFASGRTAFVTVQVKRDEGVKGPVRLALQDPPKGISMRAVNVPAGESQAELQIRLANQLPADSSYNLIVVGTLKMGQETVTAITPAILALGPRAEPPKGLTKEASSDK